MKLRFELFVEDVTQSIDFYTRILGFHLRDVHGAKSDYASVFKDTVQIGLGRMAKLSDDHTLKTTAFDQKKGLGVEIVLVVDDIRDFYEKVLETQYPIKSPLQEQPWGLNDFRIADPDGYYIRLTN